VNNIVLSCHSESPAFFAGVRNPYCITCSLVEAYFYFLDVLQTGFYTYYLGKPIGILTPAKNAGIRNDMQEKDYAATRVSRCAFTA
jgi:hypothetical protein